MLNRETEKQKCATLMDVGVSAKYCLSAANSSEVSQARSGVGYFTKVSQAVSMTEDSSPSSTTSSISAGSGSSRKACATAIMFLTQTALKDSLSSGIDALTLV
jgi:hypothetical protein